jgi:hypothetical protein
MPRFLFPRLLRRKGALHSDLIQWERLKRKTTKWASRKGMEEGIGVAPAPLDRLQSKGETLADVGISTTTANRYEQLVAS